MKFSEVKENTWIRYKGHIYYVSQVHHDYVDVMSLNYETIEIPDVVFLTNNIELIELQATMWVIWFYILEQIKTYLKPLKS